MRDVAPDVDPADTVLSVLLILPSAGSTTSSCTPCGLQEGWVWASGSLVDQDVQGLLKDPGLWEFHLQKASNPQLPPGLTIQPSPPPGCSCIGRPPSLCYRLASTVTGSLSLDCPLCNVCTQQSHACAVKYSSEVRQSCLLCPLLLGLLVWFCFFFI